MQHLDEGTIHSWLDGALNAEEAARVEAHVKECAQCQAAVAEARGFIAASSRILTALDNAPRGVIPAAAPKRRLDPIVWRIAASVLVVALGSVLVIRERGIGEKIYTTTESPDTVSASAPPVTVLSNQKPAAAPQSANAGSGKREAGSVGQNRSQAAAVATTPTRVAAPSPASVGGGNAAPRQDLNKAAAVPQVTAQNAPGRFEAAAAGRGSAVPSMNAMADEQPLRVVGRPRALGEKLTLYEVAPGDTVMLAEQVEMELQSVVVTGAGVSLQGATAAAAPEAKRAPKLAPTQDTQRSAQAQAPAPPAVSVSFAQTPDGTATLTWRDSASGKVMRLSGHHTRAELEEIRRRIERARTAAADSVKKDR